VLGEGGMGVVYRATQLSLNRVVALKVLAAELSNDAGFRTRFQREGQLQAALDHEHIVTVYEAGQTEHGLFLAMRLIDGPTLKDLIVGGQLDTRRSLRLLAQVAHALDSAHAAGLIHRDIKPQNILIGKDDHAYLADFGLTKAPDDSRLTSTGQFIGTIDYVSPEQIQGERATAASDCYSLTAVLYECLTGEVPFHRQNEAATLHAHLTSPPPRVSERRPDLPPELDDVIAAGMAKDPAARTSSARELIAAATRALSAGSALASSGQETRPAPSPSGDGMGQVTRAPGIATVASPAAPTMASPAGSTRRAEAAAAPAAAAAATDAVAPAAAAAATDAVAPAAAAAATTPVAPPAAPPAPPARPTAAPSRRALPMAAVVVVLAAMAVVAGILVGGSGSGTTSVTLASSATIGHLQLRYPSTWQLGASSPGLPGVSFSDPIVLTPGHGGGTELVAGEVGAATGPTLLPASLRARVKGALPAADPVTFGGLQAYRYTGLDITGLSEPVTLYAVPTSAGVATVACWGAARLTPSFATQCGQVAATLRVLGVSAYPLGPSASYARLLSRTFTRLGSDTTGPLSQLQSAATPSAQAAAARSLAAAYTTAAGSLSAAAVSPLVRGAHDAVVTALKQVAGGYSQAASAASAGSDVAYRSAGAQIAAGSAALSSALSQLAGLGYKVG